MVILSTNPASILSRQSSPWIGFTPIIDENEPTAPVAPAPPVVTVQADPQGQANPPAAGGQA